MIDIVWTLVWWLAFVTLLGAAFLEVWRSMEDVDPPDWYRARRAPKKRWQCLGSGGELSPDEPTKAGDTTCPRCGRRVAVVPAPCQVGRHQVRRARIVEHPSRL